MDAMCGANSLQTLTLHRGWKLARLNEGKPKQIAFKLAI
jgi:hypothetical protein